MAQIPRRLLDELTEELNALSSAGRQMVENALARLAPQFEDSDGVVQPENVAPLRAAAVEVMDAVCGEMTDLSAARTAEFYDSVRKLAGAAGRYSALAESGRIPAATEGAVRALVQRVADTGMTAVFARELGDRVDYEVKKASGDCVVINSLGDPSKPRWARIPTGAETCPFCIMLASRGFVYHSAEKAGSKGHYHPNCDCRIVPGFNDMEVEGYDTKEYYRQYVDDLQSGKLNLKTVNGSTSHVMHWGSVEFESVGDISRFINAATDVEDLQLRCAVVEEEWLKTGLSDKYRRQVAQVMNRRRREFGDGISSTGNSSAIQDASFSIPRVKIAGYALNASHPKGRDKARAFEKYLGFTEDDADEVERQIREWVRDNKPSYRDTTEFGDRYTTEMTMNGKGGKTAKVKVGWIRRQDEDTMRLTTCYVDE